MMAHYSCRLWQIVLVGLLVFSLLLTPTMSVQAAPEEFDDLDLVISEYIEGSGSDKAIELFNPSPYAVDLSEYSLLVSFDGGLEVQELNLTGILPYYETFVVVDDGSSQTLLDAADLVWDHLDFDGNDAILLKHQDQVVDSIGQLGFDPGEAWDVWDLFNLNFSGSTKDTSMQKYSLFCEIGDSDPENEFFPMLIWNLKAVDDFSNLGVFACFEGQRLPVSEGQTVETEEDVAIHITLGGYWITGDDVFEVTVNPEYGQLSGDAPALLYTPNLNVNGSDQFEFVIIDGVSGETSASGLVEITIAAVDDFPIAEPQNLETDEDTDLVITLTGSDVETNAEDLSFAIVTGPAHGTLSGGAPNLTYTPDADYFGSDSFTFTVYDGALLSDPATVNINVVSINDLPQASGQAVEVNEDETVEIILVGSDKETPAADLEYEVEVLPVNGVVTINENVASYTPNHNYYGPDSFTFTVFDGEDSSDSATVEIIVNAVNDQPAALPQAVTLNEDGFVEITLTGSDPETDSAELTFSLDQQPEYGTVTLFGNLATYVPEADYNGSDHFTFIVSDGSLNSLPATVSITINPVNDAPVAEDDLGEAYAVTADQVLTIIAPGVLANDNDVDGDTLTAVLVEDVSHGILILSPDGSFTYDPDDDYVGLDTFTYQADDGELTSQTVTVTILVVEIPVTSGTIIFLPLLIR